MIKKYLNHLLIASTLIFAGCNLDGIGPVTPVPTHTPIITVSPSSTPTSTPSPSISVSPTPSPSPTSSISDWYEVFFSKTDQESLDNIDIRLIEKLNTAKKSIRIAVFELDSPTIADALINAHKKGIKVEMVTDTDYIDEEATKKVKDAGISIVDDNRSALMHNKFIIIDDEYVWTGSFNATYNDAYRNNNNSAFIKSKELAENYTDEFNEMFIDKKFGITSPKEIKNPLIKIGDTELVSLFAAENEVDKFIVDEIKKAKSSIKFMAFSFTHDAIGDEMIKKFKEGVKVQGIFETRGANTTYSEYPKMLKEGMEVRLDGNKYNLHHKIIIIDDTNIMLGSFNFSENATSTNDENLLTIRNNKDFVKPYNSEFETLFKLAPTN